MITNLHTEAAKCFELGDSYTPDSQIYNLLNIDYSKSSIVDIHSAQVLLSRLKDAVYNSIKIDVMKYSTLSGDEMVRASGVVLLAVCLKKHNELGFSSDELEFFKETLSQLRNDHSPIVIGNLRALNML